MFITALFTIAKIRKQPKYPSIDKWIKNVVYIHKGILLSHKKDEILPFVTAQMELEGVTLSKISQTEKDKHHMISLICGL